MDIAPALKELRISFGSLLRYSFGGFLALVLSALVDPIRTKETIGAMGWELVAIAVFVLGPGVYAVHRSLVIPVHYLTFCGLLRASDWSFSPSARISAEDSISPTRWLRSKAIGVPRFRAMIAYNTLRESKIYTVSQKRKLDIAHAQNGLIMMLFEGFTAAAIYKISFLSQFDIPSLLIALCACLFFIASYPMAVFQHKTECMFLRKNAPKVKDELRKAGVLPPESECPAAAHEIASLA